MMRHLPGRGIRSRVLAAHPAWRRGWFPDTRDPAYGIGPVIAHRIAANASPDCGSATAGR